jgi:hypothetical protein
MSRPTASSWVGIGCGDLVRTTDDPRHIGRVQAVLWSNTVRIKWLDNGWLSDLPLADVVLVKRARCAIEAVHEAPLRPKTLRESPRAQLERWFKEKEK